MKSNSSTERSPMERLVTQKFALLARVGQAKRKASEFRDEAEFYFSSAIEALAIVEELLGFLQRIETEQPILKRFVAEHTSRQHQLIRTILDFWPKDTESQERLLTLLASEGVYPSLQTTPEGYSSLSSGLVIENVARIIEASRLEISQRA